MALNISDALSDGLRRTFERNGLVIAVVFVVFGLVNAVASQTLTAATTRFARETLDQLQSGTAPGTVTGTLTAEPTPLALPVPLPVAFGLVAVLAFVAEAIRIVAVRTLVSDETETIPASLATRNLLVATVNGFVGGVVVLVMTVIGLVLFVVPGVFIALSFFFVRQEIAVEDRNFLDALSASWELTSGHRVSLFGLALVVVLVTVVVSVMGGLVSLAGGPVVTVVVTTILGAVTTVFGIAVTSRAYVQLTAGADEDENAAADTDDGAGDDSDESEWKYNP